MVGSRARKITGHTAQPSNRREREREKNSKSTVDCYRVAHTFPPPQINSGHSLKEQTLDTRGRAGGKNEAAWCICNKGKNFNSPIASPTPPLLHGTPPWPTAGCTGPTGKVLGTWGQSSRPNEAGGWAGSQSWRSPALPRHRALPYEDKRVSFCLRLGVTLSGKHMKNDSLHRM